MRGPSRREQFEALGEVMRSQAVRRKLDEVADRVASRARGIAASEGAQVDVDREGGTRPKGRPYARVLAPADQEHGTKNVTRRRILGRAVNG